MLRNSNRRSFFDFFANESLLHDNLFAEPLERIFAFNLLEFKGSVLVEELVDGEIAASNTNYKDIRY